MRFKVAFVVALAVIVTVFVLQNSVATSVRFLAWTSSGVPLAAVILLGIAVGIVLVGAPLWFTVWQLRAKVRALERQVAGLTEQLAEAKGSPSGR